MALATPPIDYPRLRKALVQALALALDIDPRYIVRAEAQGPAQPRPKPPFVTFRFSGAATNTGYRDSIEPADQSTDPGMHVYYGMRSIGVECNFFGVEQDQAYSMAATVQAALYQAPTRAVLGTGLCSVSDVQAVTDASALLGTGFEGRALLEFNLFVRSVSLVDLSSIDGVSLIGLLKDAPDGATIGSEDPVNETQEG